MTDRTAASPRLERHVLVVAGIVAIGAIMTVLDSTIVSVAIRTLSTQFHAPLTTIQWVPAGYLLALAAVIPLSGWAVDRFGAKQVWLTSLVLFLAGSALCGLAWSAASLIAFRVIQGLGGGLVLPVGQAMLAQVAGRERMGRVMSLVGIPLLLGPIFGPVLGGVLIDQASWRWIFLINLPIGAVALPLSMWLLDRAEPRRTERVDIVGLLLLSPGLALAVYGLSKLVSVDGGSSRDALLGLIGAAVLLPAFVLYALRRSNPLLDLRLFGDRVFSAANLVNALTGAAMIGAMFLLPLYYQSLRGESAMVAGLLTAPQGVGAAIAMPLGGRLVDRGRAGVAVVLGALVMAAGYVAFVLQTPRTSYLVLSAALFVVGVGAGLSITPSMSAAYRNVPPRSMARATALLNIVQRIGGLAGTAVFAIVLQDRLSTLVPGGAGVLGGRLDPHSPTADAVSTAFAHTFVWPLVLAGVAVLPALLLPRHPPPRPERTPQHEKGPSPLAETERSAR